MPVKCKECGSFSVELDSLSTEENLVCTSCGVIFDSSSFENIPCLKGTSFVHDDQGVQYSKGKSEGLDKIKQLAGLFCLSVDMQDSAKRLFSFAYRKIFLKDLITTKIILAGCCVYFELRENQHSVLISDLCDHLQCTPFKFNAVLHSLEKLIGKKAPPHSVKDLVPVILKDIAFDRKQEVFKQTMRILDFCSECWLVSGRSRDSTIIAVSYVAWKSLDFSHAWITFPKYLSTFEFPKKNYHTAAERVKEIIAVFITHAEKLPWISKGTVNKNNVSLHIDDVLKYFRSLHNDVISDIDSKACSDIDSKACSDIDSKACSDIDSKACSDIDSKACNGDMQVFNEFRPKTKRSLARMATQSYDQVPPSSGCENSDESILDSEIDTYIRSDKEVSELIKVQMKMAPSLGCEDLP